MEVYILDDLLRRSSILDRFESLVWTERYSDIGDFQLVIHSNVRSRGQFVKGAKLSVNTSRRVMIIENVTSKDDSEGRSLLTVTGRSYESILEQRIVRRNMNGTETDPNMVMASNKPASALRSLFSYICVNGGLDPADIIPMYQSGSLYSANTIAEPDASVILSFEPRTLLSAIKETCDVYGLGFRMYIGPDTSKVYFNIYSGDDRTTMQSAKAPVIFSPDLDNLTNVSEFSSIEKSKNVALVVAKWGSKWVYVDDAAIKARGFDRRVMIVPASDVELPDPGEHPVDPLKPDGPKEPNPPSAADIQFGMDALEVIGQRELSKCRPLNAIDGELPTVGKYIYGKDYELGDLIEIRSDDGLTNRMRITEQIFVDDASGERSYPTLTIEEFITPGSWYAWDFAGTWDDAIGTWDEQVIA